MSARIAHFAINADDVPRARRFYEKVFGWTFQPWGPPDFFQVTPVDDDPSAVRGALQKRREIVPGSPPAGLECTFAVHDVDEVSAAVVEAGGRILMEKTAIVGVGYLAFFEDTEGNAVGAMRYDPAAE